MSKDNIFQNHQVEQDFQFTPKVAEVFDDMLDRSVPCYRQIIQMTSQILQDFLQKNDLVYDLGCSTGTTLLELARHLDHLNLNLIGIDNSRAMLDKAALKAEMYSRKDQISFVEGDVLDVYLKPAGAVILNYTLQFIRPLKRQELLHKIYNALRPGGVLIISEKVITSDPQLNRSFINYYLDFKRDHGYSEIEIAQKREALENILVPFTTAENMKMFHKANFTCVEPFFQWFNFISYVAIRN